MCSKMESKFMVKCSILLVIFIGVADMQVSNGCLEDERLGLLRIKAFFLSFSVHNSYNTDTLSYWVGADCCNWKGVKCNLTIGGHVVDLFLNEILWDHFAESKHLLNVSLFQSFKKLKSLDLSDNGFIGFTENKGFNEFPSLNKLETLNLGGNCFGNNILLSLSGLTSLKTLSLSQSCLKGSISLPSLENLTELDLSLNELNDTLHMQGFNEFPSLNKLEILNLGGNCFGNNILLSLSGLTSLKTLSLSQSCLKGSISLPSLENLRELDLSRNELNGTLHMQGLDGFSSLKRLEILNLNHNDFNNSIFSSLRGLISLKTLILSSNQLEDFIPTQDIAKLKSLEILDLSYNNYYDGAIPLQDLKNLKVLDISFNIFNGTSLPIQGFCETNNLVELNMFWNGITGQFSECVGNFSRLRLLDISYNQFSGKIPATISNLTTIEYLSLAGNYFEGPFSLSSLANNSKLRYLILSESSNNVGKFEVETEETQWQPAFQLEFLSLGNCNLNSQTSSNIPSFLLSQQELMFIDLAHNQLVGTFPLWLLHNNSKLKFLDLSDNLLTGTLQLPTWTHKLTRLQISGNNFSGQLPNHLGLFFPKLLFFSVSRNSFEGNLPPSMEQMKDLGQLDLSNNKFSGNLQISMFNNMSYLQSLFLANNNFSGSIEDGLKNTTSLLALDVSNNMILGKIPSWIGSMEALNYVQMSKNHFEGELPIEICSLHQLDFLDVSQNKLSGGVPSCFNSSSLTFLYMQENCLSGPVPHALSTASQLKVLDLSYNHFSSHIPNWLNTFTRLRVLLLKGNELQGPIPHQLCQVGEISIMDLSSNKLNGSIPSCLNSIAFGKEKDSQTTLTSYGFSAFQPITKDAQFVSHIVYYLKDEGITYSRGEVQVDFTTKYRFESYKGTVLEYMSGLDLSGNQLTGYIPQQIGDLLEIRALNLSHNKLVGFIPKVISNLKKLESLDLSNNLLSGNIPHELEGLNSLAIFNVSHNNLSGVIPTSPHFSTYPASSYYGNPHLCGSIIEQKCPSPPLPPPDKQSINLGEEDGAIIDLEAFYWSFIASYITILLGFVLVLCINPQWRRAWFYFIQVCCSYLCKYI